MRTLANPEDARSIGERLLRLTPESTRRWGRMSPAEMVCHVAEAYRHCMGELPASPVDTFFTRNVLKPLALWAPIPWPPGYPTRPEVDPQRKGRKPGDFEADRGLYLESVERFIAAAGAGTMARHPIFGTMTTREWLRWGWLHADHHLRQFGV